MSASNQNTFLVSFNGKKWQPLLDIMTSQIDGVLKIHKDSQDLVSEISMTINQR